MSDQIYYTPGIHDDADIREVGDPAGLSRYHRYMLDQSQPAPATPNIDPDATLVFSFAPFSAEGSCEFLTDAEINRLDTQMAEDNAVIEKYKYDMSNDHLGNGVGIYWSEISLAPKGLDTNNELTLNNLEQMPMEVHLAFDSPASRDAYENAGEQLYGEVLDLVHYFDLKILSGTADQLIGLLCYIHIRSLLKKAMDANDGDVMLAIDEQRCIAECAFLETKYLKPTETPVTPELWNQAIGIYAVSEQLEMFDTY